MVRRTKINKIYRLSSIMVRRTKIKRQNYRRNKNSKKNVTIKNQDDKIFPNSLWNSLSLEEGNSLSDFPEEIIFNILVWIPAASLHKLRRVCKNWLHIISSPSFIQCHLDRVQPYIIERYTILNDETRSFDVRDSEILRLRNLAIGCEGEILATCNGLLLVKNDISIHVSNPATNQLLRLPTCSTFSHHDYEFDEDLNFYKFGYAPSTKEYKVVHFFHDENQQSCEILTLGSYAWRRIDGPFHDVPLRIDEQLMLNGVLHWVVGYDYIISMDVAEETFHETLIPSCITQPDYDTLWMDQPFYLMEIRGYLSLINEISNVEFEVWMLKDFQMKEWIKLHNIDGTEGGFINLIPLACLISDKVIFQCHEKRSGRLVLSTYDFKLQKMIEVKTYPRELESWSMIAHFDSLVSC